MQREGMKLPKIMDPEVSSTSADPMDNEEWTENNSEPANNLQYIFPDLSRDPEMPLEAEFQVEQDNDSDEEERDEIAEDSSEGMNVGEVSCNSENRINGFGDPAGNNLEPAITLRLKFPDRTKVIMDMPLEGEWKEIIDIVEAKGYDLDIHEMVAYYPKRIFSRVPTFIRIKELKLFQRDTIHVKPL